MLQVYNTLCRSKQEFTPLEDKKVRLYTCGPTVYNFAHIGNLRSFTVYDLLRRYLRWRGYEVYHVMNLTDVDDKTIRDARKEGLSLHAFTEKYTKYFLEDCEKLNLLPAHAYPRATEYIDEMVDFIQALLDKGYAYKTDDGVYFKVSTFDAYGKLSHMDLSHLQSGASGRVTSDEYERDRVADFALWKVWDEDDGDVFWETPLGKGRPGWHIECSVMATKLLGAPFDIHMGGVDLIFPHHENEIAQSEACLGVDFAKYWVHAEHLLVDNKKMSKSLGNFYTLRDLLEKGHDPRAIRYAFLSVHYRQQMNFTLDVLDAAKNTIESLRIFILSLREDHGDDEEVDERIHRLYMDFASAMDDDLDIAAALRTLFDFVHDMNKRELAPQAAQKVEVALRSIDEVLGIMDFREESIPQDIIDLAEQREKARAEKDFTRADALRNTIQERGYVVDDTPEGFKVRRR